MSFCILMVAAYNVYPDSKHCSLFKETLGVLTSQQVSSIYIFKGVSFNSVGLRLYQVIIIITITLTVPSLLKGLESF